jgi:predicted dithiol-disulfide oxidoreductase (DUF899 family)
MSGKHRVVAHDDWIAARKILLEKEKAFSRLRDELNRQRRDLPWEAVTKNYVFTGPTGKLTLPDLFEGRSQLIVQHFMFAPDWEAGCAHCSFWADGYDPMVIHMNRRDVTFVAVSRAPYARIEAYRKRMGWSFKWYSSEGSDFNFDYQASFRPEEMAKGEVVYNYRTQPMNVSEREGASAFYKDASGKVFHTYSTYARGIDLMNTAYNYIDIAPKGRDENGRGQFWVKRHDEYAD